MFAYLDTKRAIGVIGNLIKGAQDDRIQSKKNI
jgi:hypothetical protein